MVRGVVTSVLDRMIHPIKFRVWTIETDCRRKMEGIPSSHGDMEGGGTEIGRIHEGHCGRWRAWIMLPGAQARAARPTSSTCAARYAQA
ncbi:hypothetical protein HYPDE_27133 [Hyphomicrobium denitrificans 1NES1]|uniref:Uncharacterized protein n=1 Tax=Hyphomicrobium denitrificans 1NES1 TaxID=670307 RepID=N0B9A8_9HYPH|nr:hypothetical protein HYPDE_27133 [Hyphomicrobium denitrificans 1NES1]